MYPIPGRKSTLGLCSPGMERLRRLAAWGWSGPLPPLAQAVVLAAWVVATALVAWAHEPWRDEADIWVLARDWDGSLGSLRQFTSGSGCPGLWPLLLLVAVKAGLPYGAMTALNWLLGAAAVALLVRSPLPPALRVLLPFSLIFGYEYPVIARPYALLSLLVLGAAALHASSDPRRALLRGLCVGLVGNTSAHGLLIGLGLGVGLLLELRAAPTRARAASAGLALALGLLAVLQLWPPADATEFPPPSSPLGAVRAVGNAAVPYERAAPGLLDRLPASTGPLGAALGVALGLALVGGVVAGAGRPGVRASLLLALAGVLGVFAFRYSGSARHHGLLQLLCAWALWVERGGTPTPLALRAQQVATGAWVVALAAGLPTTVGLWRLELREPFSGGAEAAAFLRASGLDQGELAAHLPYECVPILPYLAPRDFWYPALDVRGSFTVWTRAVNASREVSADEAARRAALRLPTGAALISTGPLTDPAALGFELVFRSSRPVFRYDEVYWIYRRSPSSGGGG